MVRESRHLWVGNLPENLRDDQIVEYFSRFGRVEKVKILPKKSPDGGLAAFVDFVDIRSATKANETTNYMGDRELRTNYNEPGNHPSLIGEGRGRGRMHMYDRGRGGYNRREHQGPGYNDDDRPRRGRYPYNGRPGYTHKRHRMRRDSAGSHDSDRPSSPKYRRKKTSSVSSQSDQSSGADNDSYSGSDTEIRGKSNSPARSNISSQSQKNTSIQIKNLSTRPGDNSIKEALFHEFKKVGDIVNIRIIGSEKERFALVKFRRPEEADKGLQSNNKIFLGNEMKISLFKGENKDKEGEANFSMYGKKHRSKEFAKDVPFDPNATRTLFVGNLDKMLTHGELRKIFEEFGDVVDVDIKKQNPGVTTYAFLQYVDINGAMKANQRMDREVIYGNRIKVGFGRGTPTNTIWIGNVAQNLSEGQLQRQFHPFGFVSRVIIDRECGQGLVSFDTIDAATYAFEKMRGRYVLGRKLLVDFASRSCKEGFYARMERSGQLDRRTLEPSPPLSRTSGGMNSGFMQGGYTSRDKGFRGGYNKSFGYSGRYGQGSDRGGHGEFRDFSQGSPEYYQDGYNQEDDYDDYEKELRDYGYRQRERERESGTRQDRDSSRNRDREYSGRERPREKKRAYTPLSDDEPFRSGEAKSEEDDDDDDDDYSEKDIQSKIVRPGASDFKRKRSDEESLHGDSPEVTEEIGQKVEKKEKKKKKDKKEKPTKKKAALNKPLADDESKNVVDDEELKTADTKAVKAEKKKKRKLSEKGLGAEEKARRKELRKLKKLKKLQSQLGRSEEAHQNEVAGESTAVEKDAKKIEDVGLSPEKNIEQIKDRERTPPTPGLEEDLVKEEETLGQVKKPEEDGRVEDVAANVKEDGHGRSADSDSEREKLEELERKREELRKLEEEEQKMNIESQRVVKEERDDKDGVVATVKEELSESSNVKEGVVAEENTEIEKEDIKDSDSDHSELVIDETEKATGRSFVEIEEQTKKAEQLQDSRSDVTKEDAGAEDQPKNLLAKKDDSKEFPEVAEDSKKPHAEEEVNKEKAKNELVVNKDIYSSESDSSDELDDADLPDIDDSGKEEVQDKKPEKESEMKKGSENKLDTPISPDRTPPTPDLEEDSLKERLQQYPYGIYPKDYPADRKGTSPTLESDEEKIELERSMKEANLQKRKTEFATGTDKDKRRLRKERTRTRKVSSSSDQDSDSAASGAEPRGRSPTEKKPRNDERPRRASPPKRTTLDRVEAIERSIKNSPRDSPDWRDRKDSFVKRDRGESPRRRDAPGRRRGSMDGAHRVKSPEFKRSSPDRRESLGGRGRREPFVNRPSPDRGLSPRRRLSIERRPGNQRGRDNKDMRRRDEDYRPDQRDFRGAREAPDITRDRRDNRDSRDLHEGRPMKDTRDLRDIRESRDSRGDTRDRGGDKNFRPISNDPIRDKDRMERDRNYNRDRDMPGRGGLRNDISDRGLDQGGPRGRGGFKEGFRDAKRPVRHTPPMVTDQRGRSPVRYPGSSADRAPRVAESRPDGIRPRTPEQSSSRSPVMRQAERRRGRSTERRVTPPRGHEREPEYHRKESDRTLYRDQADRREREREKVRREREKEETPPPPPPPPAPRKETRSVDSGTHQQQSTASQRSSSVGHVDSPSGTQGTIVTPNPPASGNTPTPVHFTPPPPPPPTNADSLLDLLRRYPVMWQGLFALKNDSAAVQMHYISGNARLAEASLPRSVLAGEVPPPLRISQRMKLEMSQLEGVNKRIKNANDHCMLLALPCGRDPLDVHAQTRALKTGFITYLQVKQAAGIINIVNSTTKQPAYVLHIFPPCEFAEVHLARVAPDLLDSAADSGHLMVLITPV